MFHVKHSHRNPSKYPIFAKIVRHARPLRVFSPKLLTGRCGRIFSFLPHRVQGWALPGARGASPARHHSASSADATESLRALAPDFLRDFDYQRELCSLVRHRNSIAWRTAREAAAPQPRAERNACHENQLLMK